MQLAEKNKPRMDSGVAIEEQEERRNAETSNVLGQIQVSLVLLRFFFFMCHSICYTKASLGMQHLSLIHITQRAIVGVNMGRFDWLAVNKSFLQLTPPTPTH